MLARLQRSGRARRTDRSSWPRRTEVPPRLHESANHEQPFVQAPRRHRRRRRRRAGAGHAPRRYAGQARHGGHHADRHAPHPRLEAQAARDRRGQHGHERARGRLPGAGALAPLPLPARRDDRHRPRAARGARRALPRRRRPAGHARSARSATTRWSSPSAASATTSARPACASTRSRSSRKADAQRFHLRMVNACIRAHAQTDAAAARAAARGDHRRRRDRRRAGGRAAPDDARGRGLRARPRRCREGHPGQRDRGRRARAAGAAAAPVEGHRGPAARARRATCTPRPRSPRCCPTACGWPTAARCRPSWWYGPRA